MAYYRSILALSLACYASVCAAATPAGFRAATWELAHHGKVAEGAIWYPASSSVDTAHGIDTIIGENPVFEGVRVRQDATLATGPHPVVLLSHGLGGHWRTLSWLGAGLAQHGAVVIALDHPNSTTRDFDLQSGLNHGTRVQDLQAALAQLYSDTDFAQHLDKNRLYVAGFSYGGWTALSMGGLTGDLAGYARHCAEVGEASSHCRDIAQQGIDITTLDAELWNASYKDDRVTAVAAIDPGLLFGLREQNTINLVPDVTLIGLGEGNDRLFATDFSHIGNGFSNLIDTATIRLIAPANHYSALMECKPMGAAILEDENDDPVCTDPADSVRREVHGAVLQQMIESFELTDG